MQTTQTHVERALELRIINTFFFCFFSKSLLYKHDYGFIVSSFGTLCFFFNIHLFPDDMELNHQERYNSSLKLGRFERQQRACPIGRWEVPWVDAEALAAAPAEAFYRN